MLILALTAFTTPAIEVTKIEVHYYQSRDIKYNDFLESNFDGSGNKLSPFVQIYMTSQSNNETYNLKELLREPDKEQFIEVMKKLFESLFKEEI